MQRFDRAADSFCLKPETQSGSRRLQKVTHVKPSEDLRANLMVLVPPAQRKAHAAFVVHDVAGGEHFATLDNAVFVQTRCDRAHATLQRTDNKATPCRVVGVDNGGL